ncbi:MAG: flippase-like domain-containing protein, partial [Clostridia bacterium]|nr:flippase-like domain-containing protein [Clostridia bacterium]
YKSTGILRYYDAVTPMNSGGQAFMVAYLTGRDIPGSTALSIPMSKLVFQNISWLIITFVCLIVSFINPSQLISDETRIAVATLSVIGFLLALFVIVFILFMSLSKTVGQKLVSWGLKLLVKLHILRNYDKHYAKVMTFIEDYQAIMKDFSKSKLEVIYQLILHSARTVLLFSIPFFIYCAFMGFDGSKFGEFFVFTALVDLSASFIPLPGGTGMNEITFQALFSVYLGGNTFWAILLWRFCSYYFYLIQGIGILSYDTLYGNKKYRWIKAKLALQKESQDFKKVQIENFRRERTKRRIKQKKSKIKE